MKLFQQVLLLCLLGAMICALAPADFSDSGYSEPDTALDVSQAALLTRTLASPAVPSYLSFAGFTEPTPPRRLSSGCSPQLRSVDTADLHKLLCVFLI